MTVESIVKKTAALLGFADEVAAYFDDGDEKGAKKAELLLTCFQLVENELALDYLPLYCEDDLTPKMGRVYFFTFSSPVVRIIKVTDLDGNPVKYRLFPAYIETDAAKVRVLYTYTPAEKYFDEEVEHSLCVSERLYSYGMAAEYCIAVGLLEEAAIWDKKYKETIESVRSVSSCGQMRSRRWV
jgi:hypothetical protein